MPKVLSTNKLLILTGLVVLGGLIYWASHYITWKEEEIDLGYSREALRDDFLAIKQFLARQGVASQSLRNFGLLDNLEWQGEKLGPRDTLVLLNAHKMVRDQRLTNLLDWVERGGTVITTTHNPFIGTAGGSDPLLDYFGITASDDDYTPDDQPDEQQEDAAITDDETTVTSADAKAEEDKLPDNYYRCALGREQLAVKFVDEPELLRIDYSEGQAFYYYDEEPHAWFGDDHGLHLAQFDWGQGLVVINSDNAIWANHRVDCHDHAYALWKLIDPEGKVWFLINQEAPSLWSLLWHSAPYGMLAALLALGFWLWANAVRFGPILTRQADGRRSLAEHIHASAMLLWRRQQHPYLVGRLREDIRQRLQQQSPHVNFLPEQEQIAYLQQLTALSATDLHKAMFSDKLQSPQDFTLAVACLQTIRKSV